MKSKLTFGLLAALWANVSLADVVGLACTIDGAEGQFSLELVIDLDSRVAEYSDETGDAYTNLELLVAPSQLTIKLPSKSSTILKISRKDLSIVRWAKIFIPGVIDKEVEQSGSCTKVEVELNNAI